MSHSQKQLFQKHPNQMKELWNQRFLSFAEKQRTENRIQIIRWIIHSLHRHPPKKRSLGLLFPSQSESAEDEFFPEAEAELTYQVSPETTDSSPSGARSNESECLFSSRISFIRLIGRSNWIRINHRLNEQTNRPRKEMLTH